MVDSKWQNLPIILMLIATLTFVICKALTYESPEIIDVYQAEVVLRYRAGGHFNTKYQCDLRLETGVIVNALCSESSKKGDKVSVAKLVRNKSNDDDIRYSSYVIQEFRSIK